jgi:site-specific DNA-cytosine methylase
MKKLTIGTTFSGIGSPEFALKHIFGKDFEKKVSLEWACDFDDNARMSFKANHHPKKYYNNVYYMTNTKDKILEMTNLISKPKMEKVKNTEENFFGLENILDTDMYIFGFPCQNFSLANQKRDSFNLDDIDRDNTHMHQKDLGMNATKTTLVFESMKIIKELSQRKNPLKYFIGENVKGLVQHDPAYIWKEQINMTDELFTKLSPKELKIYRKREEDGKTKFYKRENGLILDEVEYKGYPSLFNSEFDGKKKFIGKTLYVMENAFKELGYEIKWKILNAKDFSFEDNPTVEGGVQNRERIFIVGIKKTIEGEFFFPEPEVVSEGKKDKVINYLNKKNDKNQELHFNLNNVEIKERKRASTGVCNQTHYLNNVKYEQGQRIYDANLKSPCLTCVGEPKFTYKVANKEIFRSTTGKEMLAIQGFPVDNLNRGPMQEDGTYYIEEFKYVVSDNQLKKQAGNSMSVSTMEALMKQILKVEN